MKSLHFQRENIKSDSAIHSSLHQYDIMARNEFSLKRGWLMLTLAILAILLISSSVVNIGVHGAAVVARVPGEQSNAGGDGLKGQKCKSKILGCLRCSPEFETTCLACDTKRGFKLQGGYNCCLPNCSALPPKDAADCVTCMIVGTGTFAR